jgi:hypothetical protein
MILSNITEERLHLIYFSILLQLFLIYYIYASKVNYEEFNEFDSMNFVQLRVSLIHSVNSAEGTNSWINSSILSLNRREEKKLKII